MSYHALTASDYHHCVPANVLDIAMADAINVVVKPTAGGAKFSVSEVVSTMTIAELKEKVRLGCLRAYLQSMRRVIAEE